MKLLLGRCELSAVVLAWLLAASHGWCEAPSSSWPQWRGPNRDGTVNETEWPGSLDEQHLTRVWKVNLGPSYSGPIVVEDRVYVTETRDERTEVVSALDRTTGETVWEVSWDGALKVPFFARSNGSWIRSTPAYDDGKLFVGGMRDVLVCLDARSGSEIWRLDCVEQLESELPSFGFVCSPLVRGDYVYVQAGGAVLKLNKQTGEIVWKALEDGGGMYGSAFSSPYIATVGGREQLLVQTRELLAGVDLQTGEELWAEEVPAFRGMNILTPTAHGDLVFASSYGGSTIGFEIVPAGDKLTCTETWSNKLQGYMSSPVLIDGHVYLHLRDQRFASVDLQNGEVNWKSKPYGKYWSMVANGNQILALDERGDLLLIDANPKEFTLVDSREISEDETWAHLAVVGNEVFVRELNAMTAYRWD